MPKLDKQNHHIKQAYYFGNTALIAFLVLNATLWAYKYTDDVLPKIIIGFTLILFITTNFLCVRNGLKASKEIIAFSKFKLMSYLSISVLLWALILIFLREDLLQTFAW